MRHARWQRPMFGPFRRRAHTGVPADHFRPGAERFALTGPTGAVVALVAAGASESDGREAGDRTAARARMAALVAALPDFSISTAAESLIVAIDAAVDELMEEFDIGDEDDDEAVEAAVQAAAGVLRRAQLAVTRAEMDGTLAALHPPFTGRHTHAHSAMGAQGGDATHDHSHSHDGDSKHGHAHGQSADAPALPDRAGRSIHNLSEEQRRRIDPANEVTDPEQLSALVASAFTARGGTDAWAHLREHQGLTAALRPDGTVDPAPWHAYLCVEGIRTDDGRELVLGSTRNPDLPVSLRLLIEDEGGHWGAVTCGRIDSIEAQDRDGALRYQYGEGLFGSDVNGQLGELVVAEQTQRFVSIDPRDVTYEWVSVVVAVETGGYPLMMDCDDGCYGPEPIVDEWMRITDYVLGAATVVAMPALPQAVITLRDVPLPEAPVANAAAPPGLPAYEGLLAAGAPAQPKAEWFANPGFYVGDPRLVPQRSGGHACPLTISDDGTRCWGHVAEWKREHTGVPGMKPPRSRTGYAHFLTGSVVCDDGTEVAVGNLTFGCGHASLWRIDAGGQPMRGRDGRPIPLPLTEVLAHYDGGYGAVVMADVLVGEDDFGIWFAGAMRPDLSDEQIRAFRATNLSGDWRYLGADLEMVAVLAGVPVPGFPIARRALTAAGTPEFVDGEAEVAAMSGDRCLALVAAGAVRRVDPMERLAALERRYSSLADQYDDLLRTVRPIALDHSRSRMG